MRAVRSPLSKSLRFEIFKRDGYRCVYCGITALNAVLHVDHVEPVARGGTNDPSNLVTSCRDCNLGKSAVPLEERKLRAAFVNEEEREHGEQLRAFLAVQREIAGAKREAEELVLERWQDLLGDWPDSLPRQLPRALRDVGLDPVLEAVEVVARNPSLRRPLDQVRYFCGVIRRRREERATEKRSAEWMAGYRQATEEAFAAYWEHRHEHLSVLPPAEAKEALQQLASDSELPFADCFALLDLATWTDHHRDDVPIDGSTLAGLIKMFREKRLDVGSALADFTVSWWPDEEATLQHVRTDDLCSMWTALFGATRGIDQTLCEVIATKDHTSFSVPWLQEAMGLLKRWYPDTAGVAALTLFRQCLCQSLIRSGITDARIGDVSHWPEMTAALAEAAAPGGGQ